MKNTYLILILQNLVLFPNQEIKLELSNELSKIIIRESQKNYGSELVLVSPKDDNATVSSIKDIENIGSFCKIKNALDLPNKNIRVTLRGVKRLKISKMKVISNELIQIENEPIENPVYNLDEELAYSRKLKELVQKYIDTDYKATNSLLGAIKNVTNLSKLTDMIGASLDLNVKQKNKLFKETDYYKRARMLITILSNEIMSLELENRIEEEIREHFEKSEKEIIIREKIKALSNELGEKNDKNEACTNFMFIIDGLKVSEKIKTSMRREVNVLESTLETSPEYGSLRTHLEFITSLPWNKSSKAFIVLFSAL